MFIGISAFANAQECFYFNDARRLVEFSEITLFTSLVTLATVHNRSK